MTPARTPTGAKAIRIIHGVLTAGVVFATTAFVGVRLVAGVRPMPDSATGLGNGIATLSIFLAVFAGAVLRRRLPERHRDQAPEAFWEEPANRGAAVPMWALFEGAGILGAAAYMLTGVASGIAAVAIALIALAWNRPGALEQV